MDVHTREVLSTVAPLLHKDSEVLYGARSLENENLLSRRDLLQNLKRDGVRGEINTQFPIHVGISFQHCLWRRDKQT